MTDDARHALELVVEMADTLEASRFVQYLRDGGKLSHTGRMTAEGWEWTTLGPDDHAVRELVLSMRFFVQDNETTSFRNLEKLWHGLPIEQQYKDAVSGTRKALNEFLDSCSFIVADGENLTHRTIFDVFMWGYFAHANRKHRATYRRWKKHPWLFQGLELQFTLILAQLVEMIMWFRAAARGALDDLAEGEGGVATDTSRSTGGA